MRFQIIILALLFIGWHPSHGQECTYTLKGTIKDTQSQLPLPFASIQCCVTGTPVLADINGNFRFDSLCKGWQTLVVHQLGYGADTFHIELQSDTIIQVYIESHAQMLDEFKVSEDHNDHEIASKQEIKEEMIAQYTGVDLGTLVSQLSGVQTLQTGNNVTKPVIRGMHSNRLIILIGGVRMEGQQWGSEHAPEIDPMNAEEIALIKGAGSLCYAPDAIAGLLLVEPATPQSEPGLQANMMLGGNSNGRAGTVSGSIAYRHPLLKKLGMRIQGTLRRGGNVHTPDHMLRNTGMKEHNFSASASWNDRIFSIDGFYSQFNTQIGIYSGSHTGNLTDLSKAINSPVPLETADFTYAINRPYQIAEHEISRIRTVIQMKKDHLLILQYDRQYNKRGEYDKHIPRNDSLAALNLPEVQLELTTHHASVRWEAAFTPQFTMESGVAGQSIGNTYEGKFFIPNYRRYQTGAFTVFRYQTKDETTRLEAGMRYDFIRQTPYMFQGGELISPTANYQGMAAQIQLTHRPSAYWSLSGELATTWRPPAINELFSDGLHHSAASVEIGNASLQPERSFNMAMIVGYQNKIFTATIEPYCNWFANYLYLSPDSLPTLTIRGAFPTFKYRETKALYYCVDARFNLLIAKWLDLRADLSVVRAFNLNEMEHIQMIPSDRVRTFAQFNLPVRWVVKSPFVRIGGMYVFEQKRVRDAVDFLPPPPGYFLMEAQADLGFQTKTGVIRTGVRVTNLLNTRYRDYMNRFRYFTNEIGRAVHLYIHVPLNNLNIQKSNQKPTT